MTMPTDNPLAGPRDGLYERACEYARKIVACVDAGNREAGPEALVWQAMSEARDQGLEDGRAMHDAPPGYHSPETEALAARNYERKHRHD